MLLDNLHDTVCGAPLKMAPWHGMAAWPPMPLLCPRFFAGDMDWCKFFEDEGAQEMVAHVSWAAPGEALTPEKQHP